MNGWLLGCAAAIAVWGWLLRPARRTPPESAAFSGCLLAHRGLHDAAAGVPENSLAAYAAAVRHGVGIEADVRLTADGEVICFHDGELSRLCGSSGRPEEYTLSELSKLRLMKTEEKIPTLSALLQTVNGRVPLLIEYKANARNAAALCRAADRVLAEYAGAYRVESFYPGVLRWYRRHRPETARGQLVGSVCRGDKPVLPLLLLGTLLSNVLTRPDFLAVSCRRPPTLAVALCCRLGAERIVWTVTEPSALRRAAERADGVIFEGFLPSDSEKTENSRPAP